MKGFRGSICWISLPYYIRAIWIKTETEDEKILPIILISSWMNRLGRRSLPPGTPRPQSPHRRRLDPATGIWHTFAEWRSHCGTNYSEDDVILYWNHILRIPDHQPGGRFGTYGSDRSRWIQGPS